MTDKLVYEEDGEEVEFTRDMIPREIEIQIILDVAAALIYRIASYAKEADDDADEAADLALELSKVPGYAKTPDIFLNSDAAGKD